MGVIYILRSLPGAGKSTLADILASQAQSNQTTWAICCADDYMMVDGEYKWAPEKVATAHKLCREKFIYSIDDNVDVIIVANTNTTRKEYEYYYTEGQKTGYFVQVITVGEFDDAAIDRYTVQNTHGVPRETLVKMRDRFKL